MVSGGLLDPDAGSDRCYGRADHSVQRDDGVVGVDVAGVLRHRSGVVHHCSLGVTATAAELNILDGVTATTSEINYLDVTTLGTTEASKAVTADANGQVIFGELKETVYTLATSGTVALDPANGSIQTCASAGPTFTDSLEAGQTLVLHVTG